MNPKRIIIIGASSGIGKELALIYAGKGYSVAITGRREHLLKALQNQFPQHIIYSSFDVMEGNNRDKTEELISRLGGLDLLIYNAGFGAPSEKMDWELDNITTRTNVNGFIEIVHYAFSYFLKQGHGQIALTSSIAAIRGNSLAPAYSASKSFMSTYAEGLNIKAWRMKKDIVVTDIKPGFVDTNISKGNKRFWVATPRKAASQIVNAIEQRKRVAYITRRWWLIAQLLKIIPYNLYKRFA